MKYERIPTDKACGRETNRRAEVSLLCEVRQGTRPWKPIRLEDISPAGFRIASLPGCHTDTPLRIRIPGMQVLTAHIRWQKGNKMGCEFSTPLHVAVYEHILRQAHTG